MKTYIYPDRIQICPKISGLILYYCGDGVRNINPTLGKGRLILRVHLLDFDCGGFW